MQINKAALSGPPVPPSIDEGWTPPTVVINELVKHYTYDGVGRQIRTQSPYPNPETASGQVRTERFYYDGVRRIQELLTDPVADTGTAAMAGESGALTALAESDEPLDDTAAALKTENNQVAAAAGGGWGGGSTQTYLEREYVWGSGDGPAGVDELLVQYDRNRVPWWVLPDGGGDIVALCDLGGPPVPGGSDSTARVVAQWTYDAYGAVQSADHLYGGGAVPHALMHAGHKGLFFDRLDVGVATLAGGVYVETPRLVPFATSIYQNRNRAYNPQMGRFNQADPNATAMTLMEAASHSGRRGVGAIALAFSMEDRFADGANLYEYLGGNPWTRSDPLGLYDWEDGWEDASAIGRDAWNAYQTFSSMADPAGLLGAMLNSMVTEYSENLLDDVEWATDWNRLDDDHTRFDSEWVQWSLLRGAYEHFNLGYWLEGGDEDASGPARAGVVRTAVGAGGRALRGFKHHALPRYMARALGTGSEVLIELPDTLHRAYHKHLDDAIRSLGAPSMYKGGARALRKWIDESPGNGQRLIDKLRRATRKFEKDNKLKNSRMRSPRVFETKGSLIERACATRRHTT